MPWGQHRLSIPIATFLNTRDYIRGSLSVTEIVLEAILFCLTLTSVAQLLSGKRLILRFDLNSNLSPNTTTGQELGRGRVAFAEGLGGQAEALLRCPKES